MEPLSVLKNRPKSTITRLTKSSKILKTIINAILDKKGEHIVSLDLRKIEEAAADFFIVCQASSTTQVRAICDQYKVLLLADEPTGHLDPEVSLEIMQLFKQLNQQGTAIIMASHDYTTMRKVPGIIYKCEGGSIFPVDSL